MVMDRRWYEADERVTAKKDARKKKAKLWKYTIVTRNGKRTGYYTGSTIPKVLVERNATVEDVAV
jgi:hypothetical protein